MSDSLKPALVQSIKALFTTLDREYGVEVTFDGPMEPLADACAAPLESWANVQSIHAQSKMKRVESAMGAFQEQNEALKAEVASLRRSLSTAEAKLATREHVVKTGLDTARVEILRALDVLRTTTTA